MLWGVLGDSRVQTMKGHVQKFHFLKAMEITEEFKVCVTHQIGSL